MKRIFCLLLSLILGLGAAAPALAQEGKTPLTALVVAPADAPRASQAEHIHALAEETGVEITWEEITPDAWAAQKEARLASGAMPDLLLNAVTDADAVAHPDALLELGFLSFRHAPYVQEMFSDEPDTLALASNRDEEIYCLPAFLGTEPDCASVMYINKAWLDKLGLPVPRNLTGLQDALDAFRQNDCNGNGRADDEIPMDFCGWFGSPFSAVNLIGCWCVQLTNGGADGYFVENGQVMNYAADTRYATLIDYLKGLYSLGLISPQAVTQDEKAYLSASHGDAQGSALVGVAFGRDALTQFGPALASQYVPVGPLDNDVDFNVAEDPRWSYDFSGLNIQPCRAAISASCQQEAAAMRFLDGLYRADVSRKTLESGLAGVLPLYIRRAEGKALRPELDAARAERASYESTLALIDMVTEYYPQDFMNYTPQQEAALAAAQEKVSQVTQAWWPQWLTGQRDLNADWAQYLSQLADAGLYDILAIRQAAYQEFQGK